jgi:hypothetical protein
MPTCGLTGGGGSGGSPAAPASAAATAEAAAAAASVVPAREKSNNASPALKFCFPWKDLNGQRPDDSHIMSLR